MRARARARARVYRSTAPQLDLQFEYRTLGELLANDEHARNDLFARYAALVKKLNDAARIFNRYGDRGMLELTLQSLANIYMRTAWCVVGAARTHAPTLARTPISHDDEVRVLEAAVELGRTPGKARRGASSRRIVAAATAARATNNVVVVVAPTTGVRTEERLLPRQRGDLPRRQV